MNTQLNHLPHKFHRKSGVTLIEMMIVLVIIALIAGVALPVMAYLQKRAAISAVQTYAHNVGVVAMAYKEQYGSIPVTENLSAADIAALTGVGGFVPSATGNELRLEMVFAASESGWRWFETGLFESTVPTPLATTTYNVLTKKFDGAAAAATQNYSTFPRLECTRATALSQYNLTGSGPLALGTKVVEIIVPQVNADIAAALINKFNPQVYIDTSPSTPALQTARETALVAANGMVKIGAFDATTHLTDVRIYCGQF